MSYIGQRPVVGRYIKLDQISSGFNGSETSFSMTAGSQAVFPGTARNLLLSLGGVIQEPDTNFTISGSTLTFTTAPVANTTFFAVIFGDMQSTGTPSDGTVLPASIASSGNFSFPQLTVTGTSSLGDDVTFTGASANIVFDKSDNAVEFADDAQIRIGTGNDLTVFHESSSNFNVFRQNNGLSTKWLAGGETVARFMTNGAVELYYDNSKKFETTSSGAFITKELEIEGTAVNDFESGRIRLTENAHGFLGGYVHYDGNANVFYIGVHPTNDSTVGNDVNAIKINRESSNLNVELNHGGSKKFETTSNGVKLGDSTQLTLGDGNDFRLEHDGSSSYVTNYTGDLIFRTDGNEISAKFKPNGAAELYFDNSKKFETLTNGVQVTGSAIVDGTGTQTTTVTVKNGTDTDGTKLGHSSNSDRGFIQVTESGADFGIQVGGANTSNMRLELFGDTTTASRICFGTEEMITATPNGAVELYHNNVLRLETRANDVKFYDGLVAIDNAQIQLGNSADLKIYHDGTNSYVDNVITGILRIRGNTAGQIELQPKGGEYGVITKPNGATELYYDHALKFNTHSSGVAVTGYLSASTNIFVNDIRSITSTNDDSTSHVSVSARNAAGGHGEYFIVGVSGNVYFGAAANSYSSNPSGNNLNGATTIRVFGGISSNAYQDAHRLGRDTDGSILLFQSAGGTEGSVAISGSTTSYNTTSDYRLKENIIDITDGITRIKQLQPRRFNFIKDPSITKDGFIAHEVSSIVPEAVQGTKDEIYTEDKDDDNIKAGDPKYQAMDAGKLIPLLTAALQEAITKIETLETKVAALEAA